MSKIVLFGFRGMHYKRLIIFSALILVLFGNDVSSETTTVESLLPKEIPEGWVLVEGPKVYTKKTLFQHIDGQAELYFKYGFRRCVFAIYQSKENPQNQIELDIYDMGNVLQAFGIFSRLRGGERPMGIGLDSYLDDRSALFYKGKYFVMLYCTESNPSNLKQFSVIVSSKIKDSSLPPKEIGYFPKDGLKPGSIQYFPEGLLGHQFLKKGFQATYIEKVKAESKDQTKAEDKEFHLFLAVYENSQMAMNGLKSYKDHLSKKGKIHPEISTVLGSKGLKGEDPYQRKLMVAHKECYLIGTVGFIKEEEGERLLAELIKNMKFKSSRSR